MKVLQLCKYYPPIMGGIELVEKTITKVHRDFNDEVTIIAFAKNDTSGVGEFGEKLFNINEDIFFKSAPFNFKLIFVLKNFLKDHSIERIYVHLPNPFMHEVIRFSKVFLKKHKIDVVAVYHSDIVNQKFLGKIYSAHFTATKNVYDYWICSSQKLWDSSAILNKLDPLKKRIIPFCTDGVITYKERSKFGKKILAVGRLVPYKGFDFLIDVINKTDFELHIIGNGPELKALQARAKKNIFFHKHLTDIKKSELFATSDVLVVSSTNRSEAYGMIIVEAFEAGLPVIAANINSGVTFLVQHEKTGLVFEIKNEKELLQCLKRLEDKVLYSELSKNCRNFFEENLTYEKFKLKIRQL